MIVYVDNPMTNGQQIPWHKNSGYKKKKKKSIEFSMLAIIRKQ